MGSHSGLEDQLVVSLWSSAVLFYKSCNIKQIIDSRLGGGFVEQLLWLEVLFVGLVVKMGGSLRLDADAEKIMITLFAEIIIN